MRPCGSGRTGTLGARDRQSGTECPPHPGLRMNSQREAIMEILPRPRDATFQPEKAHHVCNMCGKPSEITICEECSERLRVEALARKKHEEQGDAWSHWE